MFRAEIWKISEFLSGNFQVLVVKFSIYLNRRDFVMYCTRQGSRLEHYTYVKFSFNRGLADWAWPRRLLCCCSSSFHKWCLFCHYCFLISPSFVSFGRLCFVIVNTKTCLFKYTENFTLRKHTYSNTLKILPPKKWKFSDKRFWYFSYFCSKHRLWVFVRTASARRF